MASVIPKVDVDKLYDSLQKEFLTDVKLLLIDNYGHRKEMTCHKLILVRFDYFEKLFQMESHKYLYEIMVPHALVAHDIIMSLYNQVTRSGDLSETKWILEAIRCYDFFGISVDITLANELALSKNFVLLDFTGINVELFMIVACIFNFCDDILEIIAKHYSDTVTLHTLSTELLELLATKYNNYWVCGIDDHNNLFVTDRVGTELKLFQSFRSIGPIELSNSGNLCAFITREELIVINLIDNKVIRSWPITTFKTCAIQFSPDEKFIFVAGTNYRQGSSPINEHTIYFDRYSLTESTIRDQKSCEIFFPAVTEKIWINISFDCRFVTVNAYGYSEILADYRYDSIVYDLSGPKIYFNSLGYVTMFWSGGFIISCGVKCNSFVFYDWNYRPYENCKPKKKIQTKKSYPYYWCRGDYVFFYTGHQFSQHIMIYHIGNDTSKIIRTNPNIDDFVFNQCEFIFFQKSERGTICEVFSAETGEKIRTFSIPQKIQTFSIPQKISSNTGMICSQPLYTKLGESVKEILDKRALS